MPDVNAEKQCAGVTASGVRCEAPRELLRWDEDDQAWWCFAHDPSMTEEQEIARQKASLRSAAVRRRHRYLKPDELPKLATVADALAYATLITEALVTGRLSSSAGNAALKAVDVWLRGHEAVDVQERLALLTQENARLADAVETLQRQRSNSQRFLERS